MGGDGRRLRVVDIERFEMDRGQSVALCGESGRGKTTFLHLIAGLIRPDAGRLRLDGHEVTALAEKARDRLRATSIGYIFQTFNLLPAFTCLENVLLGMQFGPGADRDRAISLLERVRLHDRLHHLPGQLSTGQQQRLSVARALANHPKLVLADEPTGSLDAANAQRAMELIQTVCHEEKAALLLVTHERSLLGAMDQVHDLDGLNRAVDLPSEVEGVGGA